MNYSTEVHLNQPCIAVEFNKIILLDLIYALINICIFLMKNALNLIFLTILDHYYKHH